MKVKTESKLKKTLKIKKVPKSGESTLNKAVKNVTEILKKKVEDDSVKPSKEVKLSKGVKPIKEQDIIKIKKGKKSIGKTVSPKSQFKEERGVVYIGHIPHGFYEEQMKEYFSQFGKVTNVRVSRSKRTGRSKGYGFIEFLHPEVAKVAADSMNNYLMFGRLVKTAYIPPEKQHNGYFKGGKWSVKKCPEKQARLKRMKKANAPVPNENHKLVVKKSIKNLTKLSETLKAVGIDLNIKLGEVVI